MAKIVTIAEVEDRAKWEASFASRSGFFSEMGKSIGLQSPVFFGSNDDNRVVVIEDVTDPQKALDALRDPETAEAMKRDGVRIDSVQNFIADRQVEF
jgi:hypothetical protein